MSRVQQHWDVRAALNFILGGDFVSRLNMNIREEKHWSYGAGSFLSGARGQQPFIAYAPVDAPRFAAAVVIEHGIGGSAVAAPIARAGSYSQVRQSRAMG